MKYNINISCKAESDISHSADYIAYTLKNPTAAQSLLLAINKHISSLSTLPKKHPLVSDDVLAHLGIRFININNYVAFFTIDEKHKTVVVIRLLYKKSNWISILQSSIKGV